MQKLQIMQAIPPTSRVARRPRQRHYLGDVRPYQIRPFMIAPVLPAETLNNLYFEAREVSDPINNPFIGWSSEYYWFYVKIRDLVDDASALEEMFTNPLEDVSALASAADPDYYHAGGINYTKKCLKRVTETFFRDTDEAWDNADIGSFPSAQMRDQGWMDSLIDTTALDDGGTSLGDPSTASTPEALDIIMDQWTELRRMQLTNMEFEDYLKTFGISMPKAERHEPELLWSLKDWQYPSNTVATDASGAVSSAVSWVFKKGTADRKLFKEPGFIFGVHVVRPKVYMDERLGSLAHYLNTGWSWLPAIMRDTPETSLREFGVAAATDGPLGTGPTNGYWVDMRDLFLYGDDFVSGKTGTGAIAPNLADIPTPGLVRKYLTANDVYSFFQDNDNTLGKTCLRSDGYTSLSIMGSQIDHTLTLGSEA